MSRLKIEYWNTRVIRHHIIYHHKEGTVTDGYIYGIHEVYYDENGKPELYSASEIKAYFYDYKDMFGVIEHIQDAVERTVLEVEEVDGKSGKLIDSGKYIDEYEVKE